MARIRKTRTVYTNVMDTPKPVVKNVKNGNYQDYNTLSYREKSDRIAYVDDLLKHKRDLLGIKPEPVISYYWVRFGETIDLNEQQAKEKILKGFNVFGKDQYGAKYTIGFDGLSLTTKLEE